MGEISLFEGTLLETILEAERERYPRAGLVTSLPGGSGQRPAGIMTGLRANRWTGTGGGG
jgi:hypothetical protein